MISKDVASSPENHELSPEVLFDMSGQTKVTPKIKLVDSMHPAEAAPASPEVHEDQKMVKELTNIGQSIDAIETEVLKGGLTEVDDWGLENVA